MASPVVLPVARADAPAIPAPRPEPPPAAGSPPQPAQSTRLMIEEIGNTGVYVYKVLDTLTGKLIAQIPREEVVRLSQTEDYASGAVVDTQA